MYLQFLSTSTRNKSCMPLRNQHNQCVTISSSPIHHVWLCTFMYSLCSPRVAIRDATSASLAATDWCSWTLVRLASSTFLRQTSKHSLSISSNTLFFSSSLSPTSAQICWCKKQHLHELRQTQHYDQNNCRVKLDTDKTAHQFQRILVSTARF